MPDICLCDLRHTLWLESGERPKILQEILGHYRISVTLDTYSHAMPNAQCEAMGRFAKMFSWKSPVSSWDLPRFSFDREGKKVIH